MVFYKSSGMVANIDKNSVYSGGVKQQLQEEISKELQFVKEQLPFRYLRVPLILKGYM